MNASECEKSRLVTGETPDWRRRPFAKGVCVGWLAVLLLCQAAQAAPFHDLHVSFTQPDGTKIEVVGWGDEFYAVFETLDGYTVVFDAALKAYCFAQQSADGGLVSTGIQIHRASAAALGLSQHARPTTAARQKSAHARWEQWEAGMQIEAQWKERKAALRQMNQPGGGAVPLLPPSFTTTGNKLGLTLLIDFDDDPATVPQADIIDFCNGDNYTGNANNGSVKKYYYDNSNGLLTYSNVVTVYIRISTNAYHPKSYYNDVTKDCGGQARLLILDAITAMKAMTNYATEILPTFNDLTVDGGNNVVAFNVFYAGGNGGVWSKGLWPHSSALSGAQELSPGGKKVFKYQISNIGSYLFLGTFCHENGHMLCGYPDIYDYDYDSVGGAGSFSLMDYTISEQNPCQIDAYLKRASGWATTTELLPFTSLTATVTATNGPNFNHFYRYQKPGVPTEYFLVECRYQTGRDADIPASGVAVWHVDELGDHDNQSLVPNANHANYELTLVQADNLWHFENNANTGDANDLYYNGNSATGYTNQFDDLSAPNAHWWDGSASVVSFRNFSAPAPTMTFAVSDLVWVNAAYTGGDSDGSLAKPFRTVNDGYQAVHVGGVMRVFSTNYPETLTMSKALRVEATNGVVRIGSP